eukprot:TRINITY_DN107911_c0_g1_i1.p1 TRINITY_DN107911_c0_g1~~TRINITY_DN107911_c0_g1_i1.p1  ORF type:complete len:424 (-),score=67.59 TRINITY_DN107911_c0_g1_i1:66-1337(-)
MADDSARLATMIAGVTLLGPAQLLTSAGLLRRCPSLSWHHLSARSLALGLLATFFTAWVVTLLASGFGAEDECWVLSFALAALVQLKRDRHYLTWSQFPYEVWHRRVKSLLPGQLIYNTALSLLCAMLSTLFGSMPCWAQLSASMVVLTSADLHGVLLQDSTTLSRAIGPEELVEALTQPLACEGPGLGRWVALTALAQSISYKNQGSNQQTAAFSAGVRPRAANGKLPPLAREVFGFARSGAKDLVPAANPGQAFNGSLRGSRSIFAVYLRSGLEVLREYTIRVQCLVASSWRRGPRALHISQLEVLERDVVELLPLTRISAAGLVGWVCLSRDVDESGVVQREEALQKVIYELCGLLCALEGLSPLRGIISLAPECDKALQSAQEEARHSLHQLLLTFEHFGLRQVVLPPLYKRMLETLMF